MRFYCRSRNTKCQEPKFSVFPNIKVDRPNGGDGGQLPRDHKDVPFTSTTPKTLADAPIEICREIQTLTLQVNSNNIKLAKVSIATTR